MYLILERLAERSSLLLNNDLGSLLTETFKQKEESKLRYKFPANDLAFEYIFYR